MRSLVREPTRSAAPPVSVHRGRFRLLVRAGLFAWALLAFAITASLATAHYALPQPPRRNPQLARAVAELRDPTGPDWLSVHALYSQCRCSQRIAAHLLARAAISGVQEHVLWVGPRVESKVELERAGYAVHNVSALALKRDFGAVAVPLLLVADARDRLRYVGGYASSQTAVIRDRTVLQSLMQRRASSELPVFGCAVSRSLQKLLDPFALKY